MIRLRTTMAGIATIVATAGVAAPTRATQTSGPNPTPASQATPLTQAEKLKARHAGRSVEFRVSDPNAKASSAAAVYGSARHGLTSTTGYTLHARVIVETPDAGLLQGFVATPVASLPGFFTIDAPSVAAAARLADRLVSTPGIISAELDLEPPRAERMFPNDPSFFGQWTLFNIADQSIDSNALDAWDAGYTGEGVTVGLLEFAFDINHPDLAAGVNAEASNSGTFVTSHATSVAGIVGMRRDNNEGGVGIAYGAQIASLQFGTTAVTAGALVHRNDLNDIKNNSWGPLDNNTLHDISAIELAALRQAAITGRDGKGTVMVWAAGNGGAFNDRVDYDPYASSRYTLAIGGIGDDDIRSDFNETGSSMFMVAYTAGNGRTVFTTDRFGQYTNTFGGTSASAPLAAGIIALMLDANPELTWRDVMHVLVESARMVDPDAESWITNAAGYDLSEDYGFGAIDAFAAASRAETWTNVAPESVIDSGTIDLTANPAADLPDGEAPPTTFEIELEGSLTIETVELIINAESDRVGDLRITLVSPEGTRSRFSVPRSDTRRDLVDRVFTTYRAWGEEANGTWTVEIADEASNESETSVTSLRVRAFGTTGTFCAADRNADGVADQTDILLFLADFNALNVEADWDGSGRIDFFDMLAYLQELSDGCP